MKTMSFHLLGSSCRHPQSCMCGDVKSDYLPRTSGWSIHQGIRMLLGSTYNWGILQSCQLGVLPGNDVVWLLSMSALGIMLAMTLLVIL